MTRTYGHNSSRSRSAGGRSAGVLAAVAAVGVLALAGCSADTEGSGATADRGVAAPQAARDAKSGEKAAGAGATAPSAAPAAGAAGKPVQVRQHIIRTASLGIESKDVQQTLAAARSAAEGAGGYVGNESTRRDDSGAMTSTVTLRVPGEKFDSVLGALEGGGKLLHRKVEAQDVTEKVVDVDSRVRSQQASVARVREMMDKASALGDVVMLEGELSKRQAELEALLAQQTALKDQTSLGTITLEVSGKPAAPVEQKEEEDPAFTDALKGGWEVFLTGLKWLTLVVGAVLPFALAGLVLLALWKVYRRFRPATPPVPMRGTGAPQVWPQRQAAPAAPPAHAAHSAHPSPAGTDTAADVQD
ncbi:DUF4349 domain-containing protein [Streptomyces venezuelae]|uniref:DUF4349 domain-containing protein n=1 Tax=Streptomyces venezuelae TaxID=54571 RepID=A0A5P2CXJ6_STRVZ|nr:DUF4349 domain-containing protein [Streptomyces venezuelae]QES47626.1 DUF4349 domain-containing protein [Streptomyces venezuelae]